MVGTAVGLPTEPVPAVRGFTSPPLSWNTYTALDGPLLDGGRALVLPIVAALGVIVGMAWRQALRGTPAGVVCFAVLGYSGTVRHSPEQLLRTALLGGYPLVALGLASCKPSCCVVRRSMILRLATRLGQLGAVCIAVVAFAACGSNKETSEKLAQRTVVEDAAPLPEVLITERDVGREPSGSSSRSVSDVLAAPSASGIR